MGSVNFGGFDLDEIIILVITRGARAHVLTNQSLFAFSQAWINKTV